MVVFAAASLARAFSEIEEQVERQRPDLDVRVEISGSQTAARKVAELHRRADVVATADHRVIDRILRPDHARFTARFATNAVVIAHMEHSRHTDQITADNWGEVLLRPGVRLGLVDPDQAPIGYRTLLVWKLAEAADPAWAGLAGRLRRRCAPEHLVPHEGELMRLLQTRSIDYAFVYRSTAEEHNLKLVKLPASYSLGDVARDADYARAKVAVRMRGGQARTTIEGAAITYGLTIPRRALNPTGAQVFVRQLLGVDGQQALQRTGFRPLVPPAVDPKGALERLVGRSP